MWTRGARAVWSAPVIRPSFCVFSIAAIALATAAPALAQPRQETAPRFGALRTRAETPLEVRREVVDLRCDLAGESTLDCDVTATITFANGSASDVTTAMSVTIERSTPFTMTSSDGHEVEAPTVRPLDVTLAPGAEQTITLNGHLEMAAPHSNGGLGGAIDGLAARHPLLATQIHHEVRRLLYSRPVRRDFVSLGRIELHAHLPEGWTLRSPDERFQDTHEGTEHTLVRDAAAQDAAAAADVEITLESGDGPDPVRHGGPFIAIGAEVDPASGPWSFRGRIGYELGILDILVIGASIESNFRDQAAIAALVEITTWSMVVPPALSAGIGPVFDLFGQRNAGMRLAASASIYSVGFDATFDVFPTDGHWEITLAGRAGL
jgi:hypothetical protein